MSFVYFIQDRDAKLVKIGCTSGCPYARLTQLRNAQLKKRFELMGVVAINRMRDYYETTAKREFQAKFSSLRENGDWFRIGHDLANFVREFARPHFCSRVCQCGTSIYEEALADQFAAAEAFQKACQAPEACQAPAKGAQPIGHG